MENYIGKDIERAMQTLFSDDVDLKYRRHFSYKFYMFSNEDLKFFFDNINVQNKSVLTTGSSGDQALFALANGAKKVVLFDINPYVKYYIDYKTAIIKNLSYKEFKRYIYTNNSNILSSALYAKVSHDISDPKSKQFWDFLYLDGYDKDDRTLFIDSSKNIYSKSNYLKLQTYLQSNNPNIRFINTDLRFLPYHLQEHDKFDYILLSNIYDYTYEWKNKDVKTYFDHKKLFTECVNKLTQHLNKNGQMQINYTWDESVYNHSITARELGFNQKSTYILHPPSYNSPGSLMLVPDGVKNIQNIIEM